MNQVEARAAKTKYGSIRAAAKELGMARTTLNDIYNGVTKQARTDKPKGMTTPTASNIGKSIKVRSLAEFKQTYDKDTIVPGKIRAGLKTLGATGWEYEQAFAKIAGLSMTDLGNYRDGFAELVVTIRERRAWAGSKAMADKMWAML